MRLAMGLITRGFKEGNSFYEFLCNGEKFGWHIEDSIICHGGEVDAQEINKIKEKSSVHLMNEFRDLKLEDELARFGIHEKNFENVIIYNSKLNHNVYPYGIMRNKAILKAILLDVDFLFFIDSDVYPRVLNSFGQFEEINYISRHITYMTHSNIKITTSDYSGFYIIPPFKFDGLDYLLNGLGKGQSKKLLDEMDYSGIVYDHGIYRHPEFTNKILGGNLAIDLKIFKEVLPFYSSVYEFDGKSHATRGEDTILGYMIQDAENIKCMDIDTLIFHDTYEKYPDTPDILHEQAVKDRFYRACMGWLGRNPFMYWLRGEDYKSLHEYEKSNLIKVSKEFANFISDERFAKLPEASEAAYKHLPTMIDEYKRFEENWWTIINKLRESEII